MSRTLNHNPEVLDELRDEPPPPRPEPTKEERDDANNPNVTVLLYGTLANSPMNRDAVVLLDKAEEMLAMVKDFAKHDRDSFGRAVSGYPRAGC